MLRVLVADEGHSEASLPSSLTCIGACACICIGLGHSELTYLVFEVGATKAPETHVLDAAGHECPCASRIEVDVFDLER